MLRRVRLLGLWCVLVLLVGVAPAVAAEGAAGSAGSAEASGVVESGVELVEGPPDSALGVVVADDVVVSVLDPWSWVVGLSDPDSGRAGMVAGRAVVGVEADGPAAAAEGLPVWVSADSSLWADLEVLPGDAALSPFGVAVLVDLSAADAADGAVAAVASVVLDHSAVPFGYSAGVVDRLRILRGVDCKADEKDAIACGGWVPVGAVNDPLSRSISFDVADGDLRLPKSDTETTAEAAAGLLSVADRLGAGGGVFVLDSGGSGPSGDFTATPLGLLAAYQVGVGTGHLELSYPIGVPPAFWGPEPSVSLGYSSGSVDGLTSHVNTQSGWLGVGWSFHPGYVSRRLPLAADWYGASGDFRPADEGVFFLTLGGVASPLVEVSAGVFRLESDPEWRVELLTGASNGDQQGEWWRVTTPDGLRYMFGKQEVSGSNSAFTAGVFTDSNDGDLNWCGAGVGGATCDKVWQWNLERIEDPNGYRVEFFYEKETNWYLAGTGDTPRLYVRGGNLVAAEYGDGPGKDHHARVEFTLGWRCDPQTTCSPFGSKTETQKQDGTLFPDVPVDLYCATSDCGAKTPDQSPTFFTHKELGRVLSFYKAGGSWVGVGRWDLVYSFAPGPSGDEDSPPGPGEDPGEETSLPKLTLISVHQKNLSGADELQPTRFEYTWRPNRANYLDLDTEWQVVSPQYAPRLIKLTNELGGVVEFTLGKSRDCEHYQSDPWNDQDTGNDVYSWPNDGNAIRRPCDDFYQPDPLDGYGPGLWNKWKVLQVRRLGTGESPLQTETYTYLTYPTWRYDDGTGFWSDYRGHRQVKVTDTSGAYVVHTFYTGMYGDYWSDKLPYPDVSFTTSETGATLRQDEDWLAGLGAEVRRYASGGTSLSRTVTYYTWDQTSAGDTWWSAPSRQLATTWGSGNAMTTQTDYAYLDLAWFHGLSDETRYGVAGVDQVRRTHTTYLQSTLSGYDPYYLPNQVQVFDAASGGTEVARTRLFYDGATNYTTRPGRGNLTRTRVYSQLSPTEVSASTWTSYDPTYLWPTSTTDPNGLITTYTRNSTYGYVSVETVQTADPAADPVTTTVLDPGRGLPTSVTVTNSPYDTTTSFSYDQHGRLFKVWKPTRHDTSGVPLAVPSLKFTYSTPSSGMASVCTQTLTGTGSQSWLYSYSFFDGFGRQIQTQTPDPAGGSLLTSLRYNNVGLADFASRAYYSSAAAGSGWVDPTWVAVGPHTRSYYDGAGRPIRVETWAGSTELWESTSAYGVTSGRSWVTETDAEGRWLKSYANGHGELVLVEEPDGGDVTYTYTTRGELATVTDDYGTTSTADDITISLGYDLAGRKLTLDDPDSGLWSYTYDPAGYLITQTDGRGIEITLVRDDLGRVKQRRDTTGDNNTLLAAYTWDQGTGVDYAVGLLVSTQSGATAGVADTRVGDFNADGLPLSQAWTLDGDSYTVGFSYTNDGKPYQVTYPAVNDGTQVLDPEAVTYGYDGAGRPYSITSSFDSSYTYLRATSYTNEWQPSYWALGPQVWLDDAWRDTANRTWLYDSATRRVTQLRGGSYLHNPSADQYSLQRLGYSYDDTGLVTKLVDYRNSDQRQCYTYNSRGMLTRAFTGNADCSAYDGTTGTAPFDQTHTYNAVGNITSLAGATQTYGTGNEAGAGDAGPHAVISAGGVTYTYDDAGNHTERTEPGHDTLYNYNADSWLTSIDVPAPALDWTFVYTADGERTRVQHGTGAYTYHIAGILEVDTTTPGGTVTQTRSLYDLGGGVTAIRTNNKTGGLWDPDGGDQIDFTFADHLGSVSTVWTAGDPGTRYLQRYYPWGTPRTTYNTGLPTNHTYTGQQADQEGGVASGLMYYQARYYDPRNGHFTQADTLIPDPADPQAYNRYQYVRNNPANYTDPSGHVLSNPWELRWTFTQPGYADWIDWKYTDADWNYLQGHWQRGGGSTVGFIWSPYYSKRPTIGIGGLLMALWGGPAIVALLTAVDTGADVVGCGVSITSGDAVGAAVDCGSILIPDPLPPGATRVDEVATNTFDEVLEAVTPRVAFGHGARHLEGTGLSATQVESTILQRVTAEASHASTTGSFWGRVQVNGTTIEYRAYTLSDGTINVGTYYVP